MLLAAVNASMERHSKHAPIIFNASLGHSEHGPIILNASLGHSEHGPIILNASLGHSEHGPIILNAASVILNLIQNLTHGSCKQTPHSDGPLLRHHKV